MKDTDISLKGQCPIHQNGDISASIFKSFKKRLTKKYGDKKPLKALHAKTIGLVKAKINVLPDLPVYLQKGLFKTVKEYDADIRFSHGSSSSKSKDISKSARGMAIKIKTGEEVQDIVLATNRIHFPVKPGLQKFIPIIAFAKLPGQLFYGILISILSRSFSKPIKFSKGLIKTPNILEEIYLSATPYRFGKDKAIKWHVRPMKTITSVFPENPEEDFLRTQLIKDLSVDSPYKVSFGLYVQFQENEKTEPLEDPSIEWKTQAYQVATIEIPKQDITTDELKKLEETISFSPGNCIIEHAPLGIINRIRASVYDKLAKDRDNHVSKRQK